MLGNDEITFIVPFGGVEAGYFIVKGQNRVPVYGDSIGGSYGNSLTNVSSLNRPWTSARVRAIASFYQDN